MYGYNNSPYGQPPGFGGFPGAPGAAPGMAPPAGMAPPGTSSAPGMPSQNNLQQQQQQPPSQQSQGRPGGFPPNFQPPNMPNINFAAPVIRLGTTGPSRPQEDRGGRRDDGRPGRAGVGASGPDAGRMGGRDQMALVPPTKDEIVRTIFIGGITEGVSSDNGIERILRAAGSLRRWTRAIDADNKPCRFGFAEYEDPDSLEIAIEVLKDVQVPVKRQTPSDAKDDAEKPEVEKSTLLVMVDDGTLDYLQQYQTSREDQDASQQQMRIDGAKAAIASLLQELVHPTETSQTADLSKIDGRGDETAGAEVNGDAEVITIPLMNEEELSEIPVEMRATVAKEIASFRDRSSRRDLERLRREEAIEAEQRRQDRPRMSRLDSPPPSSTGASTAGAARVNGDTSKGSGGSQQPRDYQNGVSFTNGRGGPLADEEDDTDASDGELERRRQSQIEAEQEKRFLDQERRWLNRERSRTAAVEREKNRDRDDDKRRAADAALMSKRLAEWDDDAEASRKVDDYYADRSLWLRNRTSFRAREARDDEIDRAAEARETAREQRQENQARGMADDFLSRQAAELDARTAEAAPREPARFKLSLGAAAQQKAQQQAQQPGRVRRTAAEVEGLLEDEEEESGAAKRTLIPIAAEAGGASAPLTEEERKHAARQLAADIPTDKEGLWAWPVKWEFVDDTVLVEQLKPFVEKKIVEYLGVQEQMLVEVVEEHIRKRGSASDLVEQLEGALDEEAEVLVKKLWRMLIFFSESEKRGLST